jgi:hypothetical protein
MFRLFSTIDALFVFGAIIALWAGGEPIGVLHPVSLRGIFIVLGILAITGAFAVMVATRVDRTGIPRWPFNRQGATRAGLLLFQNSDTSWPRYGEQEYCSVWIKPRLNRSAADS